MGCAGSAVGINSREVAGQSSGERVKAQHQTDFHAKYLLDERIGKGSYGLVHAVSEKPQSDGLRVGAMVKVQSAQYNGLRGQIVKQKSQRNGRQSVAPSPANMWHVKVVVDGKEVLW
jgi:hypothetical protein